MGQGDQGVGGKGGLRSLPSVDRLVSSPEGVLLAERFGREAALEAVRAVLADRRTRMAAGDSNDSVEAEVLAQECFARIEGRMKPSLRPVFNLTGTVLHTNLGRAL